MTRFLAGRDLVFGIERDPANGRLNSINVQRIAIGGPGQVQVVAGRNIDLGTSQGVVTRGNLKNPFLPEGSAGLLVIAGAIGVDAEGNALPLNPQVLQTPVVQSFFAGLLDAAKKEDGQYEAGQDAIAKLFPTTDAKNAPVQYQGDINLFFSQLKTEQGGDVLMLAPGGMVNAGLASATDFIREDADLGIITVQGGDIQAFIEGNFLVNQSRVFTISGGDILLWSNEGNIDAGKGAKTATATPPPQLRIDKNGNFVLDVSQSIAGSGIGALRVGSNATLVAPKGEVNAGDAGIRAGGDLIVRAPVVVGADNIQVGGTTSGVPLVVAGALGASLGGVGNIADATGDATKYIGASAKDQAKRVQDAAAFKPSFVSVEVVGFGE